MDQGLFAQSCSPRPKGVWTPCDKAWRGPRAFTVRASCAVQGRTWPDRWGNGSLASPPSLTGIPKGRLGGWTSLWLLQPETPGFAGAKAEHFPAQVPVRRHPLWPGWLTGGARSAVRIAEVVQRLSLTSQPQMLSSPIFCRRPVLPPALQPLQRGVSGKHLPAGARASSSISHSKAHSSEGRHKRGSALRPCHAPLAD